MGWKNPWEAEWECHVFEASLGDTQPDHASKLNKRKREKEKDRETGTDIGDRGRRSGVQGLPHSEFGANLEYLRPCLREKGGKEKKEGLGRLAQWGRGACSARMNT